MTVSTHKFLSQVARHLKGIVTAFAQWLDEQKPS